MKSFITLLSIFSVALVHAQTVFYVDNEVVHVGNGGIVYIEGDYQTENTGIADNYGQIHVQNDWINNSTNTGFTGTSDGDVYMFGTSTQNINGNETHFHDLILSGQSVKNMNVDARVLDTLDLVNAELQTNQYNMYVDNPAPTSVLWNTGYVNSSTLGGYFVRSMNTTSPYLFPVGDISLTNVYRGVQITPTTTDSTSYGVRVRAVDATNDFGTTFAGTAGPFDLTIKNPILSDINDAFYHNIARFTGTQPADVTIHYFSTDGDFFSVAQWQDNSSQWEPASSFTSTNTVGPASFSSPDVQASALAYDDFLEDPFALVGVDLVIPEFISPNSDGNNDYFEIQNIELFPGNKLQIFNRYGNVVFETTDYDNTSNYWDGTASTASMVFGSKTEKLPSGVYFYILELPNDLPAQQGYVVLERD